MWPVGSIDYMKYSLDIRTRRSGMDIPFTVGILVADINRQFARENILDVLECFSEDSGEMIDFYVPGYLENKVYDEMVGCMDIVHRPNQVIIDGEVFNVLHFNNKCYFFSRKLFNEFTRQLESHGIRITGQTQLILVPYSQGRIRYHEATVFDLEDDIRQNRIPSVRLFFDSIFKIARKTTEHQVFSKAIRNDRRKKEITDYILGKIKDEAFGGIRGFFLNKE